MNKLLTGFLFLSVTAILLYTGLSLLPGQLSRQLEGLWTLPHRIKLFSETGENKRTQRKQARVKVDGQKQKNKQLSVKLAPNQQQEKELTDTANSSEGRGQKYLVYLCHGIQHCGGWADRQRGLVNVFFLSLATDRKFGIVLDTPCNVSHFYLPRDVNWLIPEKELRGKKSMMINDMGARNKLTSRLQTMDFNQEYPHDVVYITTNSPTYHKALTHTPRYAAKLPHWARTSSTYAFAQAWKRLMRPSEYLQHQLDGYLTSIQFRQRTHPLVCCHVRIGKSDTIENDGKTRMNVSDISVLWEFVDQYVRNGSRVFLATDNYQIRNQTRQRFGSNATDTGGSIVHVDKALRNSSLHGRALSVEAVCEGFGDAVLDQLILTLCDVLVITPSGFGERAAFIRGTSDNLFRFAEGKVTKITI